MLKQSLVIVVLAGSWMLAAAPQPSSAQVVCSVINTVVGTTGGGIPKITKTVEFVIPSYNSTAFCNVLSSMSADCHNDVGFVPSFPITLTRMVVATRTGTMSPFCNFFCRGNAQVNCATVLIDHTDGLPVELMEFSVDSPANSDLSAKSESQNETE